MTPNSVRSTISAHITSASYHRYTSHAHHRKKPTYLRPTENTSWPTAIRLCSRKSSGRDRARENAMKVVRLAHITVLFVLVASASAWAQTQEMNETKETTETTETKEAKPGCPSPHPNFPQMSYDEDN